MYNDEKEFLTPREAANYLGIGVSKMYSLCQHAKGNGFPSMRLDSKFYVSRSRLQAWIDSSIGKQM